jgi:uncharacterized Zn finger protein (UPF0148 family)
MKCPKCGTPMVAQGLDEKTRKMTCPNAQCGMTETVDQRGRQLLTGETPGRGKPVNG